MIDYNINPFHKAIEYSPGKDLANRLDEKMERFRKLYNEYALPRPKHKRMIETSKAELTLLSASVRVFLAVLKDENYQKEKTKVLEEMLEDLNSKIEKELEKAKLLSG